MNHEIHQIHENAQILPVLNFLCNPTTCPPEAGCAKMQAHFGVLQGHLKVRSSAFMRSGLICRFKSQVSSLKFPSKSLSTHSTAERFFQIELKGCAA